LQNFTKTSDWLIEYYAGFKGMQISGHSSFSMKFDLSAEEEVSLLFAANRAKIFTYLLTIVAKSENHSRIKETVKSSENASSHLEKIKSVLNKDIHIVLYDPREEQFSVGNSFECFDDLDSDGMIEYFTKVDPEITQNPGTHKEINKTINDSFQIWKRNHFSKYMVFNDFDILILSKPTIFELKRVIESIDTWNPYVDDSSNYAALSLISNTNNIRLRVIAYQREREGQIALHDIIDASKAHIKGRYILCSPSDKVILGGISDFDKPTFYMSKRSRQKRY
jgi:hypothetical protein